MAAVRRTFEDYLTATIVILFGGNPIRVTTVIYVTTFGTFVFFGITGLLADKLGRKPTIYIYAVINVVSLQLSRSLLIYFACKCNLGIFILGFFMNGSFWGMFMLSKTYCVENFPTEMRGTASGWRSFAYAIGLILGSLASSFLVRSFDLSISISLHSAITAIGVSVLLLHCFQKLKE